MAHSDPLLAQQMAYYQARAAEYDQWFLRQGRYDRGSAQNQQWFTEVAQVRAALTAFAPYGDILELACGTGLWTEQLAPYAARLTAVDGSAAMLEYNRARVQSAKIAYVEADLFAWQPDHRFDVVFFGFWLSHVPPERFASFWQLVQSALRPDGRVFFVDSLYTETSTALDHRLRGPEATTITRRLNDGQSFQIVKVFYQPAALAAQLADLGWQIAVQTTPHYFLYGFGER